MPGLLILFFREHHSPLFCIVFQADIDTPAEDHIVEKLDLFDFALSCFLGYQHGLKFAHRKARSEYVVHMASVDAESCIEIRG